MNTSIELSLLFKIVAQLSYCMGIIVVPWSGAFYSYSVTPEKAEDFSLMAVGKSTHPSVLWRTGVIQAAERMAALHRGCVKTPLLPENGRAQHDFRRLAHLRSPRMLENSMVIGMISHSPEFSHSLHPLRKFGSEFSMTDQKPLLHCK